MIRRTLWITSVMYCCKGQKIVFGPAIRDDKWVEDDSEVPFTDSLVVWADTVEKLYCQTLKEQAEDECMTMCTCSLCDWSCYRTPNTEPLEEIIGVPKEEVIPKEEVKEEIPKEEKEIMPEEKISEKEQLEEQAAQMEIEILKMEIELKKKELEILKRKIAKIK